MYWIPVIFFFMVLQTWNVFALTLEESVNLNQYAKPNEKKELKEITQALLRGEANALERHKKLEQSIRHRIIDQWEAEKAKEVNRLVEQGISKNEAESQVALRIQVARKVTDGLLDENVNIDRGIERLERYAKAVVAISNLSHEKQLKLFKDEDPEKLKKFFGCLCDHYDSVGGGASYNPKAIEGHRSTSSCGKPGLPCVCSGPTGGCWREPLPNRAKIWINCIHSTDSYRFFNDLLNSLDKAKKNYTEDVCRKIDQILDKYRELKRAGKIKNYSESELAGVGWLPSWSIALTIMDRSVNAARAFMGGDVKFTSLGTYLRYGHKPSDPGLDTEYVRVTKKLRQPDELNCPLAGDTPVSLEMALALSMISSGQKRLTPADFFAMSLDVTKGDLPLAMLLAHNFLKEAAYAHRENSDMEIMFYGEENISTTQKEKYTAMMRKACEKGAHYYEKNHKKNPFPQSNKGKVSKRFYLYPYAIRERCEDIRPVYDADIRDRLGPWYHTFGLLFLASSTQFGGANAISAAKIENITRYLGLGSTRSIAKEAANTCAARIASLIVTP